MYGVPRKKEIRNHQTDELDTSWPEALLLIKCWKSKEACETSALYQLEEENSLQHEIFGKQGYCLYARQGTIVEAEKAGAQRSIKVEGC